MKEAKNYAVFQLGSEGDMKKNIFNSALKFGIAFLVLLATGCETPVNNKAKSDIYREDSMRITATENREIRLIQCKDDFEITDEQKMRFREFLKESREAGAENIAFTIISNRQLTLSKQKEIKESICDLMYKEGFIRSRVIDSGICVYKDATPSIRVDVLHYELDEPDIGEWKEDVGDCDLDKDIPKFGVSNSYNFGKMIANKADLTTPREYRGMSATDAVAAIGTGN